MADPLDPTGYGSTSTTGTTTTEDDDNRIEIEEANHNPLVSIGNWFVNGARDVGDIASGLWKMGGMAMHDVVGAAKSSLFRMPWTEPEDVDFQLDNAFNAVFGLGEFKEGGSVVFNDYQDRYGSQAGFQEGMYEHPLGFISDALTLATMGGAGAAKAGKLLGMAGLAETSTAAKVGEVGSTLSKLGHPLETAATAVGKSGLGARIAEQAATTGSTLNKVANVVKHIEGTTEYVWNPATRKVEKVSAAPNMVRRALYQKTFQNLITHDSPWIQSQIRRLSEVVQKGGPGAARAQVKLTRLNALADDLIATGTNKAYTASWYTNKGARRFVDFTVGLASGRSQHVVEGVEKAYTENFGTVGKEVASAEEIADNASGISDTPLTSDGILAAEGRGLRRAEQFPENGAPSVRRGTPDETRWTNDQPGEADLGTPEPGTVDTGFGARPTVAARTVTTPRVAEPRLPAVGTPFRPAFENALEIAKKHRRELTPKLRAALGKEAKVIAGDVKSEAVIDAKAALIGGTWRDVEDISRFRVVADDLADPAKQQSIISKLEATLGGTARKVENSLSNPMPDGSRQLRLVFDVDGSPVEVQVVTSTMGEVLDATKNLRHQMDVLGAVAKRGLGPDEATGMLGTTALVKLTKGQRISQQLWEMVADELRVAHGGAPAESLNGMRMRINRFRLATFRDITDPALPYGLDVESVFDNAYKAMRYKHGATYDPKVGQLVGGPSPLQMDDAIAKAGEMAPMYYPHMDVNSLPGRAAMMRKGARAVAQSGLGDQNLKKNTGYLLSTARYSKDARQVWRVRAAQAARMQERIDVLNGIVSEYGRKLDSPHDLREGEVLFAPGLIKALHNQHKGIMDALATDPTGQTMSKVLNDLMGDGVEKIRNAYDSHGDVQLYAVPDAVAKRLQQHAGIGQFMGPEVSAFFKAPTDLWRTLTLAGRPAWMVNNFMTNAMLLKLQGGKFTDVLRQLDKKYLAEMRELIGKDALEGLEGGMYHSSHELARQYDADTIPGAIANFMQRRVTQTRPAQFLRRKADWVQGVNSAMEDSFRRASYLTAAEKQVSRNKVGAVSESFWRSKQRLEAAFHAGLDEDSFRAALDEVNKYLNDYNKLGPRERNIIKPYLIPFYSFYKHAAKTLVTLPFEHPAKARIAALVNEGDEERMRMAGLDPSLLPGWLKSDMLFEGQTEAGDYRFLNGGGLNPFNAVMDSPLNTMHPLWKVLYETGTGRSTFTGKEFTDPNVVKGGFGSDQNIRINPATGKPEAIEQVNIPLIEHLFQQIPQYNMLKDLIAGGRVNDTSTLIDVLLHPEDELLRDFEGNPYKPTDAAKTLARLLGWSESTMDVKAMQERLLEEKTAGLKAWQDRQAAIESGGTDSSGTPGVADPLNPTGT